VELDDVRNQVVWRQLHRLSRRDDRVVAKGSSQDVERIGQEVPGRRLVAVGPEESEQPIAADGAAGRRGDHREQRDPSLLRRSTHDRLFGTGQADWPEEEEATRHTPL
jgi:hypothetical protein